MPEWIMNEAVFGIEGGSDFVMEKYTLMKKANKPIATMCM